MERKLKTMELLCQDISADKMEEFYAAIEHLVGDSYVQLRLIPCDQKADHDYTRANSFNTQLNDILLRILGEGEYYRIAAKFAGKKFNITHTYRTIAKRNKNIRKDANSGMPTWGLAIKYGLSDRQIRRIINTTR